VRSKCVHLAGAAVWRSRSAIYPCGSGTRAEWSGRRSGPTLARASAASEPRDRSEPASAQKASGMERPTKRPRDGASVKRGAGAKSPRSGDPRALKNGGGAGSCKDSAGVFRFFENARFFGQPADTNDFRRRHRLLPPPPRSAEIRRILGDIVEAPGMVARGRAVMWRRDSSRRLQSLQIVCVAGNLF